MRVDYGYLSSITLEAEDVRDELWLENFIKFLPKEHFPIFSAIMSIDFESACVLENGEKAKNVELEQCFDDEGDVWGGVERIEIDFGNGCLSERKEQIIEALRKLP